MSILFERRQLVTPGELLAEGDYISGDNVYRDGDKLYATRIGLADKSEKTVFVVAIKGCFIPLPGDFVVGKVVDVGLSGWTVDINSPYEAMLMASEAFERFNPRRNDLTDFLDVGDVIAAKVLAGDRARSPLLTIRDIGLGKISRGRMMTIDASKIPRLIGKKGSMINLLKRETGCQITIGQNGIILISGRSSENEDLAVLAISKIEEEAHLTGLTDRVAELLRTEKEKRRSQNVTAETSGKAN